MAVWDKKTLWGFMFVFSGVGGQTVMYPPTVCAVKGSTITILCTFTHLLPVRRVVWCQNHAICQGTTPSVYDSETQNNPNDPRYTYLGDRDANCTLQISDAQVKDTATLRFRMEADDIRGSFTGQDGVHVTVIDGVKIKLSSSPGNGTLKLGDKITLHCTAACTFHPLEVTWYKNNHTFSKSGPALHFSALTSDDSGNYSCALTTNKETRSLPFSLQVPQETTDQVPLVAGVAVGVLMGVAVLVLVRVFIVIKRKQSEAVEEQKAATEQKPPHDIYSNILQPADKSIRSTEDISYASINFRQNNLPRREEKAEDTVVYSSVASKM
ncbi:hypothetical protein LDENG_00061660 [Lucifuga dentata]|nr:hypothetical protein LDENG_00061660 [Lucifuga dentata]